MRATRAYITGFGTTGLLIASAFLTLFVMSAFVAFNGFPGQAVGDPVGTLLLQERQTHVNVPLVTVPSQTRAGQQTAGAHPRHSAKAERTRPKASTGPVQKTSTAPSSPAGGSAQGSAPARQTAPQLPTGTPQVPDAQLPKLPDVELPAVQAPSSSQPVLDTSGVTTKVADGVSGLLAG